MNDWYKNCTIDDIPSEKMQAVAFQNGLSDAVEIMRRIPGIRLYIPVYGKKKMNIEYIRDHYNGKNILTISSRLGIRQEKVKHYFDNHERYVKSLFSNDYIKIVREKCGDEIALRLLRNFSGDFIYVPIDGFSLIRRRMILKEFTGKNITALALRFEVSYRFVEKTIADYYAQKSEQTTLDLFK